MTRFKQSLTKATGSPRTWTKCLGRRAIRVHERLSLRLWECVADGTSTPTWKASSAIATRSRPLSPVAWRLPRRRERPGADAEASQGRLQEAFGPLLGAAHQEPRWQDRQRLRDLGLHLQFDAATGTDAFLANASNTKQEYWNLYGENASFLGSESKLADFVEGDVVQMKVISPGSYSFDTQAGGNTTVPQFEVRKITHKGSCD